MPLVSVIHGNEDHPTFICDHCGEPIVRASEGNYYWGHEKDADGNYSDGLRAAITFSHKRCIRAYESSNREGTVCVMELGTLFAYLVNSLGIDIQKERSKAAFLDRIG